MSKVNRIYCFSFLSLIILLLVGSCTSNSHKAYLAEKPNVYQQSIANKKLLFVSNQDGDREIFITNLNGENLKQLTHNRRDDYDASWSPNSQFILFTSNRNNGDSEVYIMHADGSQQTNLSRSPGYDGQPRWSPDGRTIAFTSDREGDIAIFSMGLDGADVRKLTTDNTASTSYTEPVWSPNGQWIAYRKQNERAKGDLWLVKLSNGQHRQLTNNEKFDDDLPRWSPDSEKLIYQSRRDKEYNIYSYDITSNKEFKLTNLPSADSRPRWSHSGEEIVFLSTRGSTGRTQVFIMKKDGSDQQGLTDNRFQVNDAEWLDDDTGILYVSWQRGNVSNVFLADLKSGEHKVISPAKGYQSQPLLEPAVFLTRSKKLPNHLPLLQNMTQKSHVAIVRQ